MLTILLASNIVVLRLKTPTLAAVQRRAGSLAAVNIIPLCTGMNFGLPASLLCLNRHDLAWFHRWMGRICVLHSILHGSSLLTITKSSTLATPRYIIPIVVSGHAFLVSEPQLCQRIVAYLTKAACTLVLTVPVTCGAVRRRHFQAALKSHYTLAAVALGGMEYHLLERQSVCRWYLLGAIGMWAALSIGVCVVALFVSKPWRYPKPEVVMRAANGLLWVDIRLPSTWSMQPGQYIQLWMPRAGLRACLQLLLFYPAVWERDQCQATLRLAARSRTGVVRKLYHKALASPISQRIAVLGPYGRPDNFFRFGTIVIVAEDIGLFRMLSYIEMLVAASRRRKAMVRKLEILWQHDADFGTSEVF